MKAKKANRSYTITEAEKNAYQREGYDIYDDSGRIIAYGAGKTVPFGKYVEAVKAYELLESENADLKAKLAELEKKLTAEKKKKKVD
jgi:ABC-type molybdate transport system substrate-binding protein